MAKSCFYFCSKILFCRSSRSLTDRSHYLSDRLEAGALKCVRKCTLVFVRKLTTLWNLFEKWPWYLFEIKPCEEAFVKNELWVCSKMSLAFCSKLNLVICPKINFDICSIPSLYHYFVSKISKNFKITILNVFLCTRTTNVNHY